MLAARHLSRAVLPRAAQGPARISSRSFVSPSSPLLAELNVVVPNLGDSITEGTIVEWSVNPGEVREMSGTERSKPRCKVLSRF